MTDPGGFAPSNDVKSATAALLDFAASYWRTGNPSVLDHAIDFAETFMQDHGDPRHGAFSHAHAQLWKDRAARSGARADLDTAIDHVTAAIALLRHDPTNDPEMTAEHAAASYASLLRMRFEQRGDHADLDAAIRELRDLLVLDASRLSHSQIRIRNELGTSLIRREELFGELADLHMAIHVLGEAKEHAVDSPMAHELRIASSVLANLGSAYSGLYNRTDDPLLLDRAIEYYNSSVAKTFPREYNRPTRLANLANALQTRYLINKDRKDIDLAVSLARRAVEESPWTGTERSRRLNTYSSMVVTRYTVTSTLSDAVLAIRLGESAIKASPPGQYLRAHVLNAQANRLLVVGSADSFTTMLPALLKLYDEARMAAGCPASDRGKAARNWVRYAACIDLVAALEGVQVAFSLFSAIDWHGMRLADRAAALREWSGFASEAALIALELNLPIVAISVLEQGRNRMWAQIADTRNDFAGRGDSSREDIDRLGAVHAELNLLTVNGDETSDTIARQLPTQRGERLRALNAQRREILATLSKRSLEPPAPEALHSLLAAGPAVIVNVARAKCDALLLRSSDGEFAITRLALPTNEHVIDDRMQAFAKALNMTRAMRHQLLQNRKRGRPGTRTAWAGYQAAIEEQYAILAWAWQSITGPVLQELGYTTSPTAATSWPRVWWSPTGSLVSLPLHATGHHNGSGNAVIDRIVSGNFTSLEDLIRAHNRPHHPHIKKRLLAVSVAAPADSTKTLANVLEEIDVVLENAPIPATRVSGSAATKHEVLRQIREHSWFHFAGHGRGTLTGPTDAALLATDATITLADIAMAIPNDAELAYLSACSSAAADPNHPDETLHLAAAFHMTGFRHVIAARQPIDDAIAKRVASHFYAALRSHLDPGIALHHSLRAMRSDLATEHRTDTLANPLAWIDYSHLGPAGNISANVDP
ncbi:CHAT domain-containing protein [Nocardia sp. NPDC059177]|uniref:CHAT domain-containing protein n=1 Tax=Nocardia sp. NPDC059177 TaxID=3346759 RepID=UPI0036A358B8